jgi:hypothetical protein
VLSLPAVQGARPTLIQTPGPGMQDIPGRLGAQAPSQAEPEPQCPSLCWSACSALTQQQKQQVNWSLLETVHFLLALLSINRYFALASKTHPCQSTLRRCLCHTHEGEIGAVELQVFLTDSIIPWDPCTQTKLYTRARLKTR